MSYNIPVWCTRLKNKHKRFSTPSKQLLCNITRYFTMIVWVRRNSVFKNHVASLFSHERAVEFFRFLNIAVPT